MKLTVVLQMKEQVCVELNKLSATKKLSEAVCDLSVMSCEIEHGG